MTRNFYLDCTSYSPFYDVLVREGQWDELCGHSAVDSVVCPSQQASLQSVFTTGFLLLSLGNAVFGVVLDVVGPRLCVIMGFALSIAGNAFVAFGDSKLDRGYMFILGYALIAAGGMGIFLPAFQFANAFRNTGLPCSIISAFFNVFGYIYIALRYLSVSRYSFFTAYA